MGAQRHAPAALPRERPSNHCKEAGWFPGPVGTCVENLASTGIRFPDRPVRSESLYRLSYPGSPVPTLVLMSTQFFFFFCLRNLIYFCGQQSFVGSFLLKISLCSSLGLSTLIYSRYAELRRAVAAGKCRNPTWRTANMECCLVPKYKSELELLLVF